MTSTETFQQIIKPAILRCLTDSAFDLDFSRLSAPHLDLSKITALATFFPDRHLKLTRASKKADADTELVIEGYGAGAPFDNLKVAAIFLPDLTLTCEVGMTDPNTLGHAFPSWGGAGLLPRLVGNTLGFLKLDQSAAPTFRVMLVLGADGIPFACLRIATRIRFNDTSIDFAFLMTDPGEDVTFIAEFGRLAEGRHLQDLNALLGPDVAPEALPQLLASIGAITGNVTTDIPVTLTSLSGAVSQTGTIRYVCATVGTTLGPWNLVKGDQNNALLSLQKPELHFAAVFPESGATYAGAFSGEIAIGRPGRPGTLAIYSSFFPAGSGIRTSLSARLPEGSIGVSLVRGSQIEIADLFDVLVPLPTSPWRNYLPQSSLTDFQCCLAVSGAFSGQAILTLDWAIASGLKLTSVSASLFRQPGTPGNPHPLIQKRLSATLSVGATEIDLTADYSGQGASAGWAFSGTATTAISLRDVVQDVAAKLGIQHPPDVVPDALNPTLSSLSGYVHSGTKDLVLSAETQAGGQIVVVVSGRDQKYAVVIDKYLHVGLSSLPLVGDRIAEASGVIAGVEDVGIERVQAIITGGVREDQRGHTEDIEVLNGIIDAAQARFAGGDLPRLPEPRQTAPRRTVQVGGARIHLGVTYFFADKPQPPLAFFDGPAAEVQGAPGPAPTRGETLTRARSQATWLDVQRSFGPVSVKRLGIACVSGDVQLLLDASLVLSGLTMDLHGLSLAFPVEAISQFDRSKFLESLRGNVGDRWSTDLDGLSVTYERPPLAISGGLLKVVPPPPHGYAYNGELLMKMDTWAISAVGAFAQLENGDSSLFAYGVLNAVLGGPAFFFVTGIAAGFGYNRGLTLPTLNELPGFPLIAAAIGTRKPAQLTEDINTKVYPASGQNWMAAGIRFTSFKIMDSFALLTLGFGDRFQVGLLGLSTITVPARSKGRRPVGEGAGEQLAGPTVSAPIAYAQLALEATYAPDEGVLRIAAQLTPDSYILSERCRLTGGFALYAWFTDEVNGGKPVEGGFRSGDFVLSVGGYHPDFKPPARYPSVPRVAANWRVGDNLTIKGSLYFALTPLAIMAGGTLDANYQSGNLKAWFNARVDFLLYWEPVSYHVNLKLSLGVAYTMDWWFTTKTLTAQVGVDLTLYGPPLGGSAVVDLYVCSFTIDFGPQPQRRQTLKWTEFEERFLPDKNAVCLSRAAAGLLKELPAGNAQEAAGWVVNPEKFVILTSSAIPWSEAPLVNTVAVVPHGNAIVPFGVRPCQIPIGRLRSQHTIRWTDSAGVMADVWDTEAIETVTERLPRAAWLDRNREDGDLMRQLGGDHVTAALTTGLRLKPKQKHRPHSTQPIRVSDLQTRQREPIPIPARAWAAPVIPRGDKASKYADDNSGAPDRRYHRLSGVCAPDVITMRAKMTAVLKRQTTDLPIKPNPRYLAAAANELLAAPSLWELGEMPPS